MIRFENKIQTRTQLLARLSELKRPIVFTNGVFDILHRGHVSYLDEAAQLGATLIVAVNTDQSVKRLGKGEDRPINSEADRQAMLAALSMVDWVCSFDEDTPYELIEAIRPDIIVKGGDYDMEKLPETALVRRWGGSAVAIAFRHDRSTTQLLKRVRQTA